MPAVAYVENPSDELVAIYNQAEEFFGHVPNLVKALGSNKAMCTTITEFLIQSLGDGRVNWPFKELVILKTLRVMGSHYSYGAHEKIAKELGIDDQKMGDLSNSHWQASPHFTKGEKLIFELIDQIGIDANAVPPELWERLKKHWNNGQLIELNALITTFIMIGRVGDALGVSDPVLFTKDIESRS